jgi:transposase InsO family protein
VIGAARSRAASSPAVSKPRGFRSAWTAGAACYAFIFIERLWRTVKYEEVYLNPYRIVADARSGLTNYFRFYNTERIHSSLDDQTPEEVYFKTQCNQKPVQALTEGHLNPGAILALTMGVGSFILHSQAVKSPSD